MIKRIASNCAPDKNDRAWILQCIDTISDIVNIIMDGLDVLFEKLIDYLKKNVPFIKNMWSKIEDTMDKIANVCLITHYHLLVFMSNICLQLVSDND